MFGPAAGTSVLVTDLMSGLPGKPVAGSVTSEVQVGSAVGSGAAPALVDASVTDITPNTSTAMTGTLRAVLRSIIVLLRLGNARAKPRALVQGIFTPRTLLRFMIGPQR